MVEIIESKKDELHMKLQSWKSIVEKEGKKHFHYDLTNESGWLKSIKTLNRLVEELRNTSEIEDIRSIVQEIFRNKDPKLLWAFKPPIFQEFLTSSNEKLLIKFKDVLLEIKDSTEFDENWIRDVYDLVRSHNPQGAVKFGETRLQSILLNILGELYGKLHIDASPIYNTCARDFVMQYFKFNKKSYHDFKNAFEILKQEYQNKIGKLSESEIPLNLEIDMMFNYFYRADWKVEKLSSIIRPIKEKYYQTWNKLKEELMDHVESAAVLLEELLSKNDITNEDIYKLYGVIEGLENDPRWAGIFQKGYTVMYTKDGAQTKELLSDRFLRAFVSELLNTDSLEGILKSTVWKDAWKAKNVGGTVLTSIASLLRPDLFLPVHSGTAKESLTKELGLNPKFYYPHGSKSIKQTSEFLLIAYKVAGAIGAENMIEMAFYLSKYQGTGTPSEFPRESEETEVEGSRPSYEHPIFTKLDKLLARKGQLILYGPPGTGKTWVASEYVKSKVPKGVHSFGKGSSLRDDIKYYILVMSTAKYDPSLIKEGLEETFSGKLQQAFDEVEEGDLAFVYLTHPIKKIIALAECTGKTEEGAKFRIIKLVDGPTYNEMKSEEPIKSSLAIRTMLRGTLFPLSSEEASWMASKIGFENLMDIGILTSNTSRKFKAVEFVTFHPAFSYEDFVEGIKPETYIDPETGKRELLFKVEEGVFKRIARNAYNALLAWTGIPKEWTENSGVPELTLGEWNIVRAKLKRNPKQVPKFYLIIDEINRGDIPKIFGELITLLETDKRLFMEHETTTTLPYSKKTLGVPPNLYIIGTMNTSDRSIALIDVALRRRFGFIELMPDYEVIKEQIIDKANEDVKLIAGIALSALKILNKRIRREYDRDHQIGHSYYLRLKEHLNDKNAFLEELKMTWFHEILPLLQEYFYDSPEKLKNVLKSKDPTSSFLKIERDVEDIVELKDEEEFSDETFLQALKSLIEAESE